MQHLVVGAALTAFCLALPVHAAEGDPPPATPQPGAQTDEATVESSDSADTSVSSSTAANKNLADQASGSLTKNVLLLREQATRTKNWGLLVTMSTFCGSGTFLANDSLRHQRDYVAQIFDFRPTYGFNVGSHRLRLQGRVAFEVEYTDPNTNPDRRWKPYDSSIAIADDTLYHNELTGILFNSAFRVTVPTSYESINVREQYLALGLSLGARRLIGPVQLAFMTGTTKYLNGSHVAVRQTSGRDTDGSEFARGTRDTPQDLDAGYANNNWLFVNMLSATYLPSDNLAVSASFGLLSFLKYSITKDRDAYTSDFAQAGAGTAQRFSSGVEVSYDFTHFTKDTWNLPFRLTAALGAQATTPVQDTDNKGWIPPLIITAFTDRAANNYGSIYLDFVAIF